MIETLSEVIEDHKSNLAVLEDISPESFEYLYQDLLERLIEAQEEEAE